MKQCKLLMTLCEGLSDEFGLRVPLPEASQAQTSGPDLHLPALQEGRIYRSELGSYLLNNWTPKTSILLGAKPLRCCLSRELKIKELQFPYLCALYDL